jgi:hypothetical protein
MQKNSIIDFFTKAEGYKISQAHHLNDIKQDVTFSLYYRNAPVFGVVIFDIEYFVQYLENIIIKENDIAVLKKLFNNASHITTSNDRKLSWPEQALQDIVLNHEGKIPFRIKSVQNGSIVKNGQAVVTVTVPGKFAILALLAEYVLFESWVASQFATKTALLRVELEKYFKESVDDDRQSNIVHKVHLSDLKLFQSHVTANRCGISHLMFFNSTDIISAMYNLRMLGHDFGYTGHGISYATLKLLEVNHELTSDFEKVAHHVDQLTFIKENIKSKKNFRIKFDINHIEFICKNYTGVINQKGFKKLDSIIFIENSCTIERFTLIIDLLKLHKISADRIVFGLSPPNFLSNANEYNMTYKLSKINDDMSFSKIAIDESLLNDLPAHTTSYNAIKESCIKYGKI